MLRLRRLPEGKSGDPLARRMIVFLIIGTLPLVAAMLVKDFAESLYGNMIFIAFALIVTGCILFLSDRFSSGTKQIKSMTLRDALIVGLGQMIAVAPGISRSGTSICVGLFRGFDREFAVKFSFLLSIPAILGATVVSFAEALSVGIDLSLIPYYLTGMVTAAFCGYFSIWMLRRITRNKHFGAFSYYCWGAGLVTLFLSLIA